MRKMFGTNSPDRETNLLQWNLFKILHVSTHWGWNKNGCYFVDNIIKFIQVKIGSGNRMVPAGNKPLLETDLCCHMTWQGHNELTKIHEL